MKPIRITFTSISILLAILLFSRCGNDNISAGVKGTFNYGEGNCSLGVSFRYYDPYNGYVFFINQDIHDTITNGYNSIYQYSDSCVCTNGEFTIALEPGNYFLFLKEYPIFGNDQQITVFYNQISEKEFFIYKCI